MSRSPAHDESSYRPLRFIHASDLRLDMPPHGMVDDPDHLRDRLVQSPYDAAENIFDAAIVEAVDALILAGRVADLEMAGPRAIVFLREQFARLAEKSIPVYWAGGPNDPLGAWPVCAPLPDNVHVFPVGRMEAFTISTEGAPRAHVIGTSLDRGQTIPLERFQRNAHALYTIGVACGDVNKDVFERAAVDYMALGGRHERKSASSGLQVVHYAGSPQGRSPREPGAHSCTLVEVDQSGRATLQGIPTDTLRFFVETVEVAASTTLISLETMLTDRVKRLAARAGERDLIITWRLGGAGGCLRDLAQGGAEGVVSRLRERFGHKVPAVWSVELAVEPSAQLPADWYEQQTILGDVLRRIRDIEQDPHLPFDLAVHMEETDRDGPLASLADLSDTTLRSEVLRDAAALSADLLTGPAHRESPTSAAAG